MTTDGPAHSDPTSPLEAQLPPEPVGIPPQLGWDADVPFWRPSPADWVRHLGWRNVLFLPALLLLTGVLLSLAFVPHMLWFIFRVLGLSGSTTILAIPIVLAGYGMGLAIRARKEPFCIHCGQCLYGLPAVYTCPECGRPYDLAIVQEYRRDPHWFVERWKQRRQLPRPDAMVAVDPRAPRRRSRDGT